jgi:hypothetical protein
MDNIEIVETETEVKFIKGVVKHKLKPKPEHTALALLRHCVLQTLPTTHSSDAIRTYLLQKNLRWQYYRVMREDPAKRLAYTYALNCCPVGFDVEPITRFCNNPKVCPWCFVRRWLYPIYVTLSCIPKDVRQPCKVVAWQRTKNWNLTKLPFFRSDYGPHQWCSALATVQLCAPYIDPEKGSLQLRHVGIQIVPADCDLSKQLTRLAAHPSLTFTTFEGGTNTNIVRAMATVLRFPWATLFASDNLQSFYSLLTRSDAHLLRITKYKQRGDIDGN